MKKVLDTICNDFFNSFEGDINGAIKKMTSDVIELKINDNRINKLLTLASCSASPVGEKTNAGRAAFRLIAGHVNQAV